MFIKYWISIVRCISLIVGKSKNEKCLFQMKIEHSISRLPNIKEISSKSFMDLISTNIITAVQLEWRKLVQLFL